jgi:hypothetical protein
VVIEYTQATHADNAPVAVTDLCVTSLDDTSEIIVIDRNIFDLDYGTVVIVLYIRIVVVTRVEVKANIIGINVHVNVSIRVSTEIDKVKLSIGKNRKFNGAFDKYVSASIVRIRSYGCFTIVIRLGRKAYQKDSE